MKVLNTKQVSEITGLSKETIWRMRKRGQFPTDIKIGARGIGWLQSDIETWILGKKDKTCTLRD